MDSPFLAIPESEWIASNQLAFAIRDRFPVSVGHTLCIPKRQIASWFEATQEEQRALMELVQAAREDIDLRYHPAGYNIGINVGAAAGQTIRHLHVHVIPRHQGDVSDPRGGVRGVLPHKRLYPGA